MLVNFTDSVGSAWTRHIMMYEVSLSLTMAFELLAAVGLGPTVQIPWFDLRLFGDTRRLWTDYAVLRNKT